MVLLHADVVEEDADLKSLIEDVDFRIILVSRRCGFRPPEDFKDTCHVVQLPDIAMTRAGQVKVATLVAAAESLVHAGDRVSLSRASIARTTMRFFFEKKCVTLLVRLRIADALKHIDWFMRDLRTGEKIRMDLRLLDLLWEIDGLTPSNDPLYTMSCFRSESTNAWLSAHSDGVDPSSFHMRGMAIDLTQNFSDPAMIYRVAKKIGKGGAGYYPIKHPFVHIDVGPVDTWVHPQHGRLDRAEQYDREQAAKLKG